MAYENADRVLEFLEELVMWTRFMARGQVEQTLNAVLKDPKHRTVYELTDGGRTQTQIGEIVGLDQSTVSDLWARWRKAGLLRENAGRPKHLISLSALGWEVPLPSSAGRRRSRQQ